MCRDKKTATATSKSTIMTTILTFAGFVGSPAFADFALDALVAAYPDYLLSHDNASIVWKDGTAKRQSLAPRSL